jgi:hypothetical protein
MTWLNSYVEIKIVQNAQTCYNQNVTGIPQRVALLKKSHLLHGLNDAQLQTLAEQMQERTFAAGEIIVAPGSRDQTLYFIADGKVLLRNQAGKETCEIVLRKGDYFGEETAYTGRPQVDTAQALTAVTLLTLDGKGEILKGLLKKYPQLRPNFEVAISSRRLGRQLCFKWLNAEETPYFLARKHRIALYQSLILPMLLSLIPIGMLLLGLMPMLSGSRPSMVAMAVGSTALLLIMAWIIWLYIDWSNDYYIVTNQRVIWLEKVIGIHESRYESPISATLSVSVESDYWGQWLDYGNVIVRTFVGQIVFQTVMYPAQAARIIEEQWQRSKESALGEEKEKMKSAIRARLGLPAPPPTTVAPTSTPAPAPPPKKRLLPPIFRALLGQHLRLRIDTGGTIIYHKHWMVFLRKIFWPLLGFLALLALLGYRLWSLWRDPEQALIRLHPSFNLDMSSLLISLAILGVLGVIFYRFWDWTNDIYMVTDEQVIDVDRTPFGKETRTVAPLDNILSTGYSRIGIMANLFNFGDVQIDVGSGKLVFENVADPAGVQADIDRRRVARMAKKKESEAAAERERMANWLAVYHQSADELRGFGNS